MMFIKNPKTAKTKSLLNLLIIVFALFTCTDALVKKPNKVLVFSKTEAFRHKVIPNAIVAITKLGQENDFEVVATEDATVFTLKNLKKYKAIVFLNTTGNVLDDRQQKAFEEYIRSGGGFVGIHAASDTEFDWQWYGNLVGAYFSAHPKQQTATLKVVNSNHPSTSFLPKKWTRFDEWYNFKWLNPDLNVLIEIDETSYDAGPKKMGANHPMAWYHEYDGGRAFYTALGHTDGCYQEPLFLQHLLGGIKYAMGK